MMNITCTYIMIHEWLKYQPLILHFTNYLLVKDSIFFFFTIRSIQRCLFYSTSLEMDIDLINSSNSLTNKTKPNWTKPSCWNGLGKPKRLKWK